MSNVKNVIERMKVLADEDVIRSPHKAELVNLAKWVISELEPNVAEKVDKPADDKKEKEPKKKK